MTASSYKRIGLVLDAGGGRVDVAVDRDLDQYPAIGSEVYVQRALATPPHGGIRPEHREAFLDARYDAENER